jgi:hypothetical protein
MTITEIMKRDRCSYLTAKATSACSAVERRWHCVFCKEPLTRPGGEKWWIAGSSHDEGLCYDCILAGMRVIMAGVEYAQEHGEGTNENPKLEPPNESSSAACGRGGQPKL